MRQIKLIDNQLPLQVTVDFGPYFLSLTDAYGINASIRMLLQADANPTAGGSPDPAVKVRAMGAPLNDPNLFTSLLFIDHTSSWTQGTNGKWFATGTFAPAPVINFRLVQVVGGQNRFSAWLIE